MYRHLPVVFRRECGGNWANETRSLKCERYAQQRSQRWDARGREQAAHQDLARMLETGFRKLAFTLSIVDEIRGYCQRNRRFCGGILNPCG